MRHIMDDSVVVILGKRRTGKSRLLQDLLFYHRDIPIGTVISPTEEVNRFFSNFIPPSFIHYAYDEGLISKVITRQKDVIMKMDNGEPEYQDADPRSFLIFDDCLYASGWAKDELIKFIFMNGRHIKTLFMITMQYAIGIPPNLRTNIDFSFIFRESNYANRERLYKQYCGMFPTFDVFNQVMDQCTENFECLVVNNITSSNQLSDQVFWYKASLYDDNPFKIGAEVFWKKHEKNFTNNIFETDDNSNNWSSLGKKSRIAISVDKTDEKQEKKEKRRMEKIREQLKKKSRELYPENNRNNDDDTDSIHSFMSSSSSSKKEKPNLRQTKDFYKNNEDSE